MGWRDEQAAATRRKIVDTFLELAASGEHVSIKDVVGRSGVSSATVFRHFPNRAALVTAAANRDVMAGVDPHAPSWQMSDFVEHTRHIWQGLAANITIAREATVSDAGRELRIARFEEFRTGLADAARRAGVPDERVDALVAAIAVLASAPAFLDLHDRQGLDVDQAVDITFWAVESLVVAAGGDLRAFTFTDDQPPSKGPRT